MRITEAEKKAILQVIHHTDPEAKIWLFGSRTDDTAKGGDIDLLIISRTLQWKDKIRLRVALYEHLGEQKIDIVIAQDDSDPFTRIALTEGMQL